MNALKHISIVLMVASMLSLAGCNLPIHFPTVVPSSPVPPVPTQTTPTVLPASPTPLPPTTTTPNEISLPTPTLGLAIQHLTAGKKIDVTTIRMLTTKEGWAIGGLNKSSDHVFRTQDGGQTWRDVTPPEPVAGADEKLAALGFFKDATHAWVAYGPEGQGPIPPFVFVWSTHDGGATWNYSSIPTSVSSEAFSPWYLNFADYQHGWLLVYLGAGMNHNYVVLFVTRDGGTTWTDILDPLNDLSGIQSFPKTGMIFVDAQTGWLTRDGNGVDMTPHIFRTPDGGVTWKRIDLPAPAQEPGFYDHWVCSTHSPNAFSAQTVILAMKCLDTNTFKTEQDYLYSTNDSGGTWKTYPLPADTILGQGLWFLDPQTGLVLGSKVYRTTDGGKNWTLFSILSWDGQFSFIDPNNGWAVARNQDKGEIALVRTSPNAGKWDGRWDILTPVVGP